MSPPARDRNRARTVCTCSRARSSSSSRSGFATRASCARFSTRMSFGKGRNRAQNRLRLRPRDVGVVGAASRVRAPSVIRRRVRRGRCGGPAKRLVHDDAPRWLHAHSSRRRTTRACFRLAKRFHGDACARWAVFLRLVNWFVFFCETRSFSNCVEACLTTWALVYWPLEALGSAPAGRGEDDVRWRSRPCLA